MYQQVTIVGRLGKDPVGKGVTTSSGVETTVVNFSVAVNERWTDGDGNKREHVEWFQAEAWGELAKAVEKYLSQGRLVLVEGKLRTDRWENEQGPQMRVKLVADRVVFLDAPDK